MLAQVMAIGGLKDEALDVLATTEAAFRKLGDTQGVAHVAELRQLIGGGG